MYPQSLRAGVPKAVGIHIRYVRITSGMLKICPGLKPKTCSLYIAVGTHDCGTLLQHKNNKN